MIRVLQIYDSIAVSSGISSVLMSWYRNIGLEDNIKMDFLCSWKRNPSYEDVILENGSNVWYIEQSDHIQNYFRFIKKTKRFFEEHLNEYDIVHLHSATFSFPFLYYAKKYGIKIRIMHVHSSSLGNTRLSSLRNKMLFFPMRNFANNFWACSEEAAKIWFRDNGINNYFIVMNGIETVKYKKNKEVRKKCRNELKLSDKDFAIGHISNMTPIKNIPFLILLFARINKKMTNAKLVLVGKQVLDDEIVRMIKENGIEQAVINVGVRTDVCEIIQAFDLCLMPSISEGYGLVPVEMQAANVPVIMSTGFPAVVCFSKNSYRLDLVMDEWERKIDYIINNQEYRNYENDSLLIKEYDMAIISQKIVMQYKKLTQS